MDEASELHRFERVTEYRSIALDAAWPGEPPNTQCATCPLARWYKKNTWDCFCTEFKALTYEEGNNRTAAVVACDARELALIEIDIQQKEGK